MTSTTVNNGQIVNNVDVTSGNFLDVSAGGIANNTTIENGGFLAVEATSGGLLGGIFGPKTGGVANGVTVNSGGELELRGTNSNASNIVLNGGIVVVDTTASVTGSLTFGPTTSTQGNVVALDGNNGNFKPTLVGFSASSSLSDNAVHFSGATLTTSVSNGDTIATLSGNGVSNTFTFAGTPQLMIVPDNGDDSGPEAVIVTTNTTTNFSAPPGTGQASQAPSATAQPASASAQGDTVSALQAGHASSQPAMSFLTQPHGGAPAGQAATAATTGTQPLSAIAHEAALPQNGGLAGVLSQPQIHRVDGGAAGFLPSQTTGGGAGALFGALQHATAAAVTHTPLHIG